jgi:5-methylcytosine-specific restriction endonuclease McrA
MKATRDAWLLKNAAKIKAQKEAWRLAHMEAFRLYAKRTAERYPEKTAARERAYRRAHRAEVAAQKARWARAHPDAVKAWAARGYALRRGAPTADFTAREWREMKERCGGRCYYCGDVKPLQQDHVVPVSRGGAHTASNIVPACAFCNNSKHTRPAPLRRPS